MKIFDFFRFKVLAGKPQRVRKNMALSLLAVACMFLRRSNFVTPLFARALFWFCTSTVYAAFLFRDMHFGDSKIIGIKRFSLFSKNNDSRFA